MEENVLELTEYGTISAGEYTAIKADKDVKNDGKVCAERIEIGGHATFTDEVEASVVEIQGNLTLVGALRADQIIVRGDVEATGTMEAGELVVDGNCTLHDTVQAGKLSVKGNTSLDSELIAEEVLLTSMLDGNGSIKAGNMQVGGKIDYHGTIEASEFIAKAYHRGYIKDLRSGHIAITHPFFLKHPTSLIYRDYFTIGNVECNKMYVESTGMSVVKGSDIEVAKRCIIEELYYLNNLTAADNCRLEQVEKIEV